MDKLSTSKHWTEESTKNFTHRIASDFLAQLETKIEKGDVTRTELANRLKRTLGRVSQLFNPGNITLDTAVRLVRAMDMKVALIAYDDQDPKNHNGPVNSELFYACWKYMGGPKTFFELASVVSLTGYCDCVYSDQVPKLASNIGTEISPITAMPVTRSAMTQPVLH